MVRVFYTLHTWFETKKSFSRIKQINYRVYRILLFIIGRVVPLYYKLTPSTQSGVNAANGHQPQVVVSLTSFPPKMDRLWMVLESLLRQTTKPDRLLLWLATTQFPSLEDVDARVRALEKRGLEIRFCEDLKSHKKYYYAMQVFPDDLVITVDDDIFYPETLIEDLLTKHLEYPECVVCYRAHTITLTEGKVNKYTQWDQRSKGISGPSHRLLATNGGGVLYPPKCLSEETFNLKALQALSPNSDDLWLKCMGTLHNTKTVKVYPTYSEVFTTLGSEDSGLSKSNVTEGQNDAQLKNILERYSIDFYERFLH
ncbi:MAG TPA: glycosyltransferase family A protein [Desulfosporosinus sp.]|nr:glycosyltransferase family A protein [Desulfosporosinus sp.]